MPEASGYSVLPLDDIEEEVFIYIGYVWKEKTKEREVDEN
jgi:hypothetical protein